MIHHALKYLPRWAALSLAALLTLGSPISIAASTNPASSETTPAQTGDPALHVDALLEMAHAYQAVGQQRNALAALRKAQPLAESLDDPTRRAAVLGALGKTLWLTGATDQARRELEQSTALARQAHAPHIAAASLNHLGNLYAEQGNAHAARAAYQDSLELARQAQDPALVATVLINTARLAVKANDPRTAEVRLAEAARQVQALPDSRDKAFHLLAIGQLRRNLPNASTAQRAQAEQDFIAAAALARTLNDQRSLSYALAIRRKGNRTRAVPPKHWRCTGKRHSPPSKPTPRNCSTAGNGPSGACSNSRAM